MLVFVLVLVLTQSLEAALPTGRQPTQGCACQSEDAPNRSLADVREPKSAKLDPPQPKAPQTLASPPVQRGHPLHLRSRG